MKEANPMNRNNAGQKLKQVAVALMLMALSISASVAGDFMLTWDAVPGATGYQVYCSTSNFRTATPVLVAGDQLFHRATNVADGTYTCATKSINATQQSEFSAAVSVQCTGGVCGGNTLKNPCVRVATPTAFVVAPNGAQRTRPLYDGDKYAACIATMPDKTACNDKPHWTQSGIVNVGTSCEVEIVRTSGRDITYRYVTNDAGVRGLAVCR